MEAQLPCPSRWLRAPICHRQYRMKCSPALCEVILRAFPCKQYIIGGFYSSRNCKFSPYKTSEFCDSRVPFSAPYRFGHSCFHRASEGSSFLEKNQTEEIRFEKAGENVTFLSSSSTPSSSSALSASSSFEDSVDISDQQLSKTKRLVETAMLASAAGLAYFLSNTFRIENYFGCFFPLPLVIMSLRWGVSAGRKTMAATAMLLLVLSGPLKAATYLLMHGFLGMTMGALWRMRLSWGASLLICTLVRSVGAMGFVFVSSWLIRDNILNLIIINAHASISFMLAAIGINVVPSMGSIYFVFGTLVLLNCGTFVFLLHVLYGIFLKRMGLHSSLVFPSWLKAL